MLVPRDRNRGRRIVHVFLQLCVVLLLSFSCHLVGEYVIEAEGNMARDSAAESFVEFHFLFKECLSRTFMKVADFFSFWQWKTYREWIIILNCNCNLNNNIIMSTHSTIINLKLKRLENTLWKTWKNSVIWTIMHIIKQKLFLWKIRTRLKIIDKFKLSQLSETQWKII